MKYCAFLRGVNVNGTSMKMAEVCKVFEKAGMQNVSSILATGNILFSSDKNREEMKTILENAMSQHFDYEAFLFIKAKEEIETVFQNNPFEKSENAHVYVFVGIDGAEDILMEAFANGKKSEKIYAF